MRGEDLRYDRRFMAVSGSPPHAWGRHQCIVARRRRRHKHWRGSQGVRLCLSLSFAPRLWAPWASGAPRRCLPCRPGRGPGRRGTDTDIPGDTGRTKSVRPGRPWPWPWPCAKVRHELGRSDCPGTLPSSVRSANVIMRPSSSSGSSPRSSPASSTSAISGRIRSSSLLS